MVREVAGLIVVVRADSGTIVTTGRAGECRFHGDVARSMATGVFMLVKKRTPAGWGRDPSPPPYQGPGRGCLGRPRREKQPVLRAGPPHRLRLSRPDGGDRGVPRWRLRRVHHERWPGWRVREGRDHDLGRRGLTGLGGRLRAVALGRLVAEGVGHALGGAQLVALQTVEVAVERLVHRDDVRAGAAALRVHLAAQCVVDAVGHQRMEHHAVAREHDLDDVARLEFHDHRRGGAGAGELLAGAFAGSLGDGFGHVADGMGEEVFDAEIRLRVHGAAWVGLVVLTLIYLTEVSRQGGVGQGGVLVASEAGWCSPG